jgi:hypothetical protein
MPAHHKYKKPRVKSSGVRNYILKQKYGIDNDMYYRMLASQDGVCAICGEVDAVERHLAVDHNHDTGEVRGLLCTRCNLGLGLLKEIKTLVNAIAYLEEYDG